jgi:hypothetical protein
MKRFFLFQTRRAVCFCTLLRARHRTILVDNRAERTMAKTGVELVGRK